MNPENNDAMRSSLHRPSIPRGAFGCLVVSCWLACLTGSSHSQEPMDAKRSPTTDHRNWFDLDDPIHDEPPSSDAKQELSTAHARDGVIVLPAGGEDAAATTLAVRPEERPAPRRMQLASDLEHASATPTQNELQELSQWIRWLALMNLPPNLEDNRKWGRRKEVFDGVDMKMDGWRLDTKRKWKSVNHGTWSRYYIEFIDPADRLQVDVLKLQIHPTGKRFTTSIQIVAPMKLFARVSQFQRDIQWFSISTKADAVVAMRVDCDVEIRINPIVLPPEVELRPSVTDASIELRTFDVSEISQIHGDVAEWLGDGLHRVLNRRLASYREKLVDKMNASIAKQQSKLKLSAQAWFESSFQKSLPTSQTSSK